MWHKVEARVLLRDRPAWPEIREVQLEGHLGRVLRMEGPGEEWKRCPRLGDIWERSSEVDT